VQSSVSLLLTAKDQSAGKTIRSVTHDVSNLDKTNKRASKSSGGLSAAATNTGRAFAVAQGPLGSYAGRLTALGTAFSGFGGPVGLAVAAIAGLGAALVKATSDGKQYEKTIRILRFATDDATESFDFARETADKYAASLEAGAKSYGFLAASAKGSGIETEKIKQLFEGVTAASSTMSMSLDDTNGMFRAFSQVISKGTLQSEEIKGQIGERLPGAFKMAADSLNMTTDQFSKSLEQGKVDSVTFINAISDSLMDKFEGSGKESVKSLQGQINLLGNAWYEFGVTLSKTGALDLAAEAIGTITKAVKLLDTAMVHADLVTDVFFTNLSKSKNHLAIALEISDLRERLVDLKENGLVMSGEWLSFSSTEEGIKALTAKIKTLEGQYKKVVAEQPQNLPTKPDGEGDKDGPDNTPVIDAKFEKELEKYQNHYTKLAEQAAIAGADEVVAEEIRHIFKMESMDERMAKLEAMKVGRKGEELASVEAMISTHNNTVDEMELAHDEKVLEMERAKNVAIHLERMNSHAAFVAITGDKEEAELLSLEAELARIDEQFALKKEAMIANGMTEEEIQAQIDEAKIVAAQKTANKLQKIDEEGAKSKSALNEFMASSEMKGAKALFSSMSTLMDTENRKQFEIGKAASVASASISAISTAMNAYESASAIPYVGWILGPVAAAAALAAGVANVQKIASTPFGGNTASSASFSSSSVSVPSASSTTSSVPDAPVAADTGGTSAINVTVQGGSVLDANFAADLADQLAGPMEQAFGNNRQYQVNV